MDADPPPDSYSEKPQKPERRRSVFSENFSIALPENKAKFYFWCAAVFGVAFAVVFVITAQTYFDARRRAERDVIPPESITVRELIERRPPLFSRVVLNNPAVGHRFVILARKDNKAETEVLVPIFDGRDPGRFKAEILLYSKTHTSEAEIDNLALLPTLDVEVIAASSFAAADAHALLRRDYPETDFSRTLVVQLDDEIRRSTAGLWKMQLAVAILLLLATAGLIVGSIRERFRRQGDASAVP